MFNSVPMRKPGSTRQEVIRLKSPIPPKLGTNVGFGEGKLWQKEDQNILFPASQVPPPKTTI